DPFPLVESYLEYYFQALEQPSPLVPEWTCQLIESNHEELDKHISHKLGDPHRPFYNNYIKWMARGSSFPSSTSWLDGWKDVAKCTFGDMLEMLNDTQKNVKEGHHDD